MGITNISNIKAKVTAKELLPTIFIQLHIQTNFNTHFQWSRPTMISTYDKLRPFPVMHEMIKSGPSLSLSYTHTQTNQPNNPAPNHILWGPARGDANKGDSSSLKPSQLVRWAYKCSPAQNPTRALDTPLLCEIYLAHLSLIILSFRNKEHRSGQWGQARAKQYTRIGLQVDAYLNLTIVVNTVKQNKKGPFQTWKYFLEFQKAQNLNSISTLSLQQVLFIWHLQNVCSLPSASTNTWTVERERICLTYLHYGTIQYFQESHILVKLNNQNKQTKAYYVSLAYYPPSLT